jgi:hypothetical protein
MSEVQDVYDEMSKNYLDEKYQIMKHLYGVMDLLIFFD